MKVAHFGNFAPYRAGIHSMVKDLILAERTVGIESNYIDYGSEVNCTFSRVWMSDGKITTMSPDWAIQEADIIVHHSAVPVQVKKTGKPIVFYLHGRPEYSFLLDWMKNAGCLRAEMNRANDSQYKKFITFWESHLVPWKFLFPHRNVDVVSPPIDLENFSVDGPNYIFDPKYNGSPNILICDMWREDITPFNSIMAAIEFSKKHCPTAKIHVVAIPKSNKGNPVIDKMFGNLRESDCMGYLATIVKNLSEIMRSADILISPNNIENRTILEASALGLPIVAGTGCKLATCVSDPRNIQNTVTAIKKCWAGIKSVPKEEIKKQTREKMAKQFSLEKTGEEVKKLYEEIL